MKVVVIANGEWDISWGRNELKGKQIDVLICADGGGNLAISSGRIPDVLVGDFDSITQENFSKCLDGNTEIKKYPAEKDETDLELAVKYAEATLQCYGNSKDEIFLYAGGGKRLDHLLGNIALMLGSALNNRRIRMIDKNYQAWIMLPGKEIIQGFKGQELSIVVLSEQARVTSKGLYYELANLTLLQSGARGISNVFKDEEAEIELHEGRILIITLTQSEDEYFKK